MRKQKRGTRNPLPPVKPNPESPFNEQRKGRCEGWQAKGKQQFQGAGRRFRGDIWLDQKSLGTMAELQSRGIKFPAGVNGRQTQEFKKPSTNVSSICSSAARREDRGKKKAARQRSRQQPSSPQPKKIINRHTICMGNRFVATRPWLHPPCEQLPAKIPDAHENRTPSWERGVRGPDAKLFRRERELVI